MKSQKQNKRKAIALRLVKDPRSEKKLFQETGDVTITSRLLDFVLMLDMQIGIGI